jgi:hypothetical protein
MNTYKAIEIIYELAQSAVGPEDAKKSLAGIICGIISEIEAEGQPVTDENISNKLNVVAHEFLKVARKQSA